MTKPGFPLPVKAVMIDLDGTLLDTVTDLAVAVNLMLAGLARPTLDEAQVRTFVGKGIANLVKRALVGALSGEPDAALFERAMPMYMDCYASVNGKHATLYPGVLEGLEALQAAGFPLACVTNKSERYTLPLLRQMRLDHYFSFTVAGDTLSKSKPDPLPLTHVCGRFGVAPAQAARAAGCPVFCVTYGYNEGADVRELDVDAIVDSLYAATRLITKSTS